MSPYTDRAIDRRYRRALAQETTYPEDLTGAALGGALPAGYDRQERRVRLGEGADVFERAAASVMAWGVQRGSGFAVHPGSPPAAGTTALVIIRLPGLPVPRLVIPCRVVATVSEEDRVGFAYGTLPGHPECGEESFVVVRDGRGAVWFEVRAFSRPCSWYARLGGPLTRLMQRAAASRYLRAVAAAVGAGSGSR
ncbi:DUF1990 domain-containing protein [Streptomyces sp. NPDC047108]|uniref:DUF1990 family protein n=1 Tax=Streptomyces sp. NPDC047108 TaxID=3155025 RepID=UPI0033FAF00E